MYLTWEHRYYILLANDAFTVTYLWLERTGYVGSPVEVGNREPLRRWKLRVIYPCPAESGA